MSRAKLPGYTRDKWIQVRKGILSKYNMIDFTECVKVEVLLVNDHMFQKSAINHYYTEYKKRHRVTTYVTLAVRGKKGKRKAVN